MDEGKEAVEERMLAYGALGAGPRSPEEKIARYVEEALLGPASQDSYPLFPRETRLQSLLYRDGVVYLDLSESAALALEPGISAGLQRTEGFLLYRDIARNLITLKEGIMRNFGFVKAVRFFITGNEAFPEIFRINDTVKQRKSINSA
jgi:hypothetical protein